MGTGTLEPRDRDVYIHTPVHNAGLVEVVNRRHDLPHEAASFFLLQTLPGNRKTTTHNGETSGV